MSWGQISRFGISKNCQLKKCSLLLKINPYERQCFLNWDCAFLPHTVGRSWFSLTACSPGEIHGVDKTWPVHGADKTLAVHGADKTSTVHGVDKTSAVHGADKTSAVHGADKTWPVHGADKTWPVHGADKTSAVHGADKTSTVHGADKTSAVHGADKTSTVHGVDKTSAVHGADKTSTVHGVDKTSAVHGVDKTSAVHGADKTRTVHGADKTWTVHGADKTWTVHGADKTWTVHGVDKTWALHGADKTSTVHGADKTWAVHGVDRTSAVHDVDKTSTVHAVDKTSAVHGVDTTSAVLGADKTSGVHFADKTRAVHVIDKILAIYITYRTSTVQTSMIRSSLQTRNFTSLSLNVMPLCSPPWRNFSTSSGQTEKQGQLPNKDTAVSTGSAGVNSAETKPETDLKTAGSVQEGDDAGKKLTLYQRFKKTYKEHGKILVAVHLLTSAVWFGSFYTVARCGVDVVSFMEKLNFSEKIITPFRSGGLGDVAVAYLMYKLATPARYTVTIGGTNLAIRYLRKEGKMPHVPHEDRFRSLYKEGKEHIQKRSRIHMRRLRKKHGIKSRISHSKDKH